MLHKVSTMYLWASKENMCHQMFSKFLRNPSSSFVLHFIRRQISHSTAVNFSAVSKEGEVTAKHFLIHSFWKARSKSDIFLLSHSLLIVPYYSKMKFTRQSSTVLRPPVASTETIRLPALVSPSAHSKFLLTPCLCVLSFQTNHITKVLLIKRTYHCASKASSANSPPHFVYTIFCSHFSSSQILCLHSLLDLPRTQSHGQAFHLPHIS